MVGKNWRGIKGKLDQNLRGEILTKRNQEITPSENTAIRRYCFMFCSPLGVMLPDLTFRMITPKRK